MNVSAHGVKRILRTRSCPRCATDSAGTWRNRHPLEERLKEALMGTAQAGVNNLTAEQLDQLCVNTIRTLSMDAVQQANSGHPGTPMALAPLVYTIWNRVMRFDPQNPI